MGFHGALGDVETEAVAIHGVADVAGAEELPEDLPLLRGRDPAAGVLHAAEHLPTLDLHLHRDLAALGRVLHGVAQEVLDGHARVFFVQHRLGQRGGHVLDELHALFLGLGLDHAQNFLEEGIEIHLLLADLHPAKLDAGNVEDHVHQLDKAAGNSLDGLDVNFLFLSQLAHVAAHHHFQVPLDGRNRCRQLMTDDAE